MKRYKLTEEGKLYLKKGLPERNLVKLLNSSPEKTLSMEVVTKKIKNFPIALKWVLEKEWVSKKDDKLILIKFPEKTDEEKALKKINEGKEVEEEVLKILISRNLVLRITETYIRTEEAIKKAGNIIGELTHDIIRTGLWKNRKFKTVDIETVKKLDKSKITPGKRHPYNYFLMQVRKKLVELGFKEMTGPIIELEFWNFDALYQAQDHPSRDWAQTYSLKYPKNGDLPDKKIVERVKTTHENGWKTGSTGWGYKWSEKKASKLMPRAHDTAITPRYLAEGIEIPGRYFNMVRCFRPDVIDPTHGVEFIQTGGIVVAKDIDFRHLLGLLKQFVREIAGVEEVKFFTDYYPFTEPSVQISGKHPDLGWVELAGAGIFRPELTEPLGVKEPVIAWGFGIDRLAMHALKITDIRELFSRNLEWLKRQKVIRVAYT